MMETANTTKSHDLRFLIWTRFNLASLGRIFKTRVDAIRLAVTDIVAKEPAQVVLVEDDHVIDELSLT